MQATVDSTLFRQALGKFATGVTVITAADSEMIHGMTANSLTSVSLDPPIILVCVDHRAKMLPLIRRAGAFGVNILGAGQERVSRHFANQAVDQKPEIAFTTDRYGVPLLEDALATLGCTVHQELEVGDHAVIFGCVEHVSFDSEDPLCFYQGKYTRLAIR